MLISKALAATDTAAAVAAAPSPADAFFSNMGLILVMFVLFYVLLIRPQQKRMKAQQTMLSALKKGDRVVTGAGFVGTISDVKSEREVEVDLGNGFKVTALRYTITSLVEDEKKAA